MLVDATRWTDEDQMVLELIGQLDVPSILAFNKIDLLEDRSSLLEKTAGLTAKHDFDAVVYISAEKNKGLDDLLEEVFRHLPEAEPRFDPDLFTDRSERFLAAELVREQLMLQLHQEIPYGVTVVIERFERVAGRVEIDALILVASDRHKGMVIGKGGRVLKRVGTRARREIGGLLDERVHLELHVKTRADWMDDEGALDELGYSRDH
jgi:GTP-binding protein Era